MFLMRGSQNSLNYLKAVKEEFSAESSFPKVSKVFKTSLQILEVIFVEELFETIC